jgi:polyhydroxybutyrate depolymerase
MGSLRMQPAMARRSSRGFGITLTVVAAACVTGVGGAACNRAPLRLPSYAATADYRVAGFDDDRLPPRVVVPDSPPAGIVVWFHPSNSNGANMQAVVAYEQTSTLPVVVAYPSARTGNWDLESPTVDNKDVQYIKIFIESLSAQYNVPAERVVAAGLSNGAYFVNALACRVPGLVGGIAAHSGGAPYETPQNLLGRYPNGYYRCTPSQAPVHALIVHGQRDDVVDVSNGELAAKYWGYIGGCTGSRPSEAGCVRADSCTSEREVSLCLYPQLGHGLAPDAGARTDAFVRSVLTK